MHELAIAQSLVVEACRVASQNRARKIDTVMARVGPLSGVEPSLLVRAFTVARAGTPAENATLVIDNGAIEVHCPACGATSDAEINKIICGACGAWQVQIISGDELILNRVELSGIDEELEDQCATPADAP